MAKVTADKIVKKAKSQVGYLEKPVGSNRTKYGKAFGWNGVAWCAIFVWWCFTNSGMKCPFGKCAYVPTISTKLRKRKVGGKNKAKPGDIRITFGCGHIGLCVAKGGKVVAGNSGNGVRYESAGGTYYRPTYAKATSTKKTTTTKASTQPKDNKTLKSKNSKNSLGKTMNTIKNVATQAAKNAATSSGNVVTGTTSGSRSSGSGSSSGSKYIEAFNIKPTTTTIQPKDIILTSSNPILEKSKRIKTLEEDIQKVLKLYPNDTDLQSLLSSLKNVYDYNASSLQKVYAKLTKIMGNYLVNFSGTDGTQCYVFSGDSKDELRYGSSFIYTEANKLEDYFYYNFIDKDWLKLFNELTLKRDSLTYFIETDAELKSPLFAQSYQNKRHEEMLRIYNIQLQSLYKQMEAYKKEHVDVFDNGNLLSEINQNIKEYESRLDDLNSNLKTDYTEETDIQDSIDNYIRMRDNLLEQKKKMFNNYFSDKYTYWNKDIIQNPSLLNFWIEFWSNDTEDFDAYNVKNIGLRTIATSDSNVRSVYTREVPQVIYYTDKSIQKTKTGYTYLYFPNNNAFNNSSQGISAKNVIDDLLYQHSYCSSEINLTTIPIYYLNPNTRILVYNEKSKVNNEYIINKIALQLSYSGTTNITATKAVERLY